MATCYRRAGFKDAFPTAVNSNGSRHRIWFRSINVNVTRNRMDRMNRKSMDAMF